MHKRAEQVDQTRQRITEAAVRLHTTVGPANTTISALAEEAGVTRLTVYRHFPDEEELFNACGNHWVMLHPPPDPDSWRQIPVIEERARHALQELYGWYRENGEALFPIRRDMAAMPSSVRELTHAADALAADALVDGCGVRGRARRVLRAAAGHVVNFWTWRSLVVDQGLDDSQAVQLAVRFLAAAAPATDG
ncbi:MAG: TetR family transcriptional regulator [Nitriliruptorales bacterium]|nr:TetR family transcriptional regulator [Nitriliruptorales bacterium]